MPQADDIGFLIKLIHDGIERQCNIQAKMGGLTRAQNDVVMCLLEHAGEKVRVRDLVEYLRLDQSTVSGILKRMVRNGHVICTRDSSDRRQRIVTLSPDLDAHLVQSVPDGQVQLEADLTEGLTQEQIKQLKQLLLHIYHNTQRV